MIKELNKYLANQAILVTKLHNLHWNVVGDQFKQVHLYTEDLYNTFFDGYDGVAEMIRQRGSFPAASMKEYLNIASIKEMPNSKAINDKDVLNIVYNDLLEMREQIIKVRKEADKENDFILVSYCDDQVKYYDKEIWFLSATLNK